MMSQSINQQPQESNIIPIRTYYDYLKQKISYRHLYADDLHIRALTLVRPSPGFLIANDSPEPPSIDQCVLCCQLVRDSVMCSTCDLKYCVKCVHYLIILFKLNHRQDPSVVNVINLIGQSFNCLTISCPEISVIVTDPQSENFNKYKVKCIHPTCDYVSFYRDACYHSRQECQRRRENFRFDISFAGEIFNSTEDPQEVLNYDIQRIEEQMIQSRINLENLAKAYQAKFTEYTAACSVEEINPISSKRVAPVHPEEPLRKQQKTSYSHHLQQLPQLLTRNWEEFSNYHSIPKRLRPDLVREEDNTLRIPLGWKKPRLSTSVEEKSVTSTHREDPIPSTSSSSVVHQYDLVNIRRSSSESSSSETDLIPLEPEETNEIDSWESSVQPEKDQTISHLSSSIGPYRTKADKRREARHRRKERERAITIRYDPELLEEKSMTSVINWDSPSTSSFANQTKDYQPDSQGPSPKVEGRERDDFKTTISYKDFIRRHKEPAKHNLKERIRKAKIHQKILNRKRMESITDMAPPKAYAVEISKAIIKAKNLGLKVCAIDMENTKIRLKDQSIVSVPIWIAIVDGSLNIVYNEFVRHPTSSLIEKDFGTEWHGLTKKDVNQAKPFNHIRKEVIDFLRKYDRIIVSGQTGDFVNLFISINDHLQLLPKIICVSSYYNCRIANEALGLKYSSFLLFNVILQDKAHSPLIDAIYTLYLYLIDFDRIEDIKSELIVTKNMNQGFRGYIYPKNPHMASLLRATMNLIGDWPAPFKYTPLDSEKTRQWKIKKQKFKPSDFIPGTPSNELPFPYILDEVKQQSLTTCGLRRTRQKVRS